MGARRRTPPRADTLLLALIQRCNSSEFAWRKAVCTRARSGASRNTAAGNRRWRKERNGKRKSPHRCGLFPFVCKTARLSQTE